MGEAKQRRLARTEGGTWDVDRPDQCGNAAVVVEPPPAARRRLSGIIPLLLADAACVFDQMLVVRGRHRRRP